MPLPAQRLRFVPADDKTVMAPELSLRGGRRPTWRPERAARGSALGVQSREGSCDFADGFPVIQPGTARLPRAQSALAMTILEASRHRIHVPHAAGLHGAQGAPLQTQLVHTVLTAACTNRQHCAGSGQPVPTPLFIIRYQKRRACALRLCFLQLNRFRFTALRSRYQCPPVW